MFKNRGINHESQAITTTEAWLHYLSVQFQTRKRETFYKQANKYLTLSGYLCRTRRLIPQNERWLSGGIVANLPKVSSTFSAFPSSSSSSSSSRGKSSKKELNQGFYSISFFFFGCYQKTRCHNCHLFVKSFPLRFTFFWFPLTTSKFKN